jgi:hypothetical protein
VPALPDFARLVRFPATQAASYRNHCMTSYGAKRKKIFDSINAIPPIPTRIYQGYQLGVAYGLLGQSAKWQAEW